MIPPHLWYSIMGNLRRSPLNQRCPPQRPSPTVAPSSSLVIGMADGMSVKKGNWFSLTDEVPDPLLPEICSSALTVPTLIANAMHAAAVVVVIFMTVSLDWPTK